MCRLARGSDFFIFRSVHTVLRVAFSRCISKERGLRTAEGQSGASFRPEKAVAAAFEAAWGALHRAGQIFSHAGTEETFGAKAADAAQNVWKSGRTAAAGAAKKGFLHTVAGKVTAVLVGLAVVGGAAGPSLPLQARKKPP